MDFKHLASAIAVISAIFAWNGPARAVVYNCNIDTTFGGFCFFDNAVANGGHPHAGFGVTYTDEVRIALTGPGTITDSSGSTTALQSIILGFKSVGMKSFSYSWYRDTVPGSNDAGTLITALTPLSTTGSLDFALPLTGTTPNGQAFSYYHLFLTVTNLKAGDPGFNKFIYQGSHYSGSVQELCGLPGTSCVAPTLPLPPAAVLFGTALAGLGVLGRNRRKRSTAQA